jgi:putative flippase GtrA
MKNRLVSYLKGLFHDKRVRFLFVGGLNTVVGYGSYSLFLFLGLHYFWATTLSTALGILNSYFWNKYFTFRTPRRSGRELVRFLSVYAVSYLMNLGILKLMVDIWHWNGYLAGAVALLLITLISYFGHNFFSFKKKQAD